MPRLTNGHTVSLQSVGIASPCGATRCNSRTELQRPEHRQLVAPPIGDVMAERPTSGHKVWSSRGEQRADSAGCESRRRRWTGVERAIPRVGEDAIEHE